MVRPLTTLALLLVGLLALPAQAQSAEVKRFLNAAMTLYENLEYEKALRQLKKARVKATGPDDEMKVSLLEGIVLADLGKEERALTAFKTAFGFDVEAKLPLVVSPKVVVIAENARSSVRRLLKPQLEQEQEEQRLAQESARVAKAQQQQRDAAPTRAVESTSTAEVRPTASVRVGAWVAAGVGLGCAGAATYFLLSANARYWALREATLEPSRATTVRDEGKRFAMLGYVFSAVAALGVGTAIAMFVLSARPAPAVSVTMSVSPWGATVGFQGSF